MSKMTYQVKNEIFTKNTGEYYDLIVINAAYGQSVKGN